MAKYLVTIEKAPEAAAGGGCCLLIIIGALVWSAFSGNSGSSSSSYTETTMRNLAEQQAAERGRTNTRGASEPPAEHERPARAQQPERSHDAPAHDVHDPQTMSPTVRLTAVVSPPGKDPTRLWKGTFVAAAGHDVTVNIAGDQTNDLDCWVSDGSGKRVGQDLGPSKGCSIAFIARNAGQYQLTVGNFGSEQVAAHIEISR